MIQNTATKHAPWYVVPPTIMVTRLTVARRRSRYELTGPPIPEVDKEKKKNWRKYAKRSAHKE